MILTNAWDGISRMSLPPDLDAIWRGNPLPPESLILATYNAGLARASGSARILAIGWHR